MPRSAFLAPSQTLKPAAASRRATSRPMPLLAPVTSALFDVVNAGSPCGKPKIARRGARGAPEALEILPNPLPQLRSPVRLRDAETMSEVLKELLEIAGRHAHGRRAKTAIPRVLISRSEAPTPPLPSLCEPAALFVLQGVKSVLIGDRALRYDPASYFIYAVETPAIGQIIEASTARPYLAIGYTIDVQAVAALLVEHEPAIGGDGFTTYPVNDDLLDAWRRMMRLLDRPVEIPVLAAMLEREIIFRLLQGPEGEKLRLLA